MFTTLNKIREQGPCIDGWERLLRSLGKTKADDEPLSLLTVLDSNGLDDTLWCFRAVDGFDKEKQLFAVWCARQVQHLMTDPRSLVALDVAERFALGAATRTELDAARDAAWDAARSAARSAARDAAQDAAWAAAWAAAWSAARGAAESAARDAARDAAWAAAESAARDAAWAAAESAARSAAEDAQEAQLRKLLEGTEYWASGWIKTAGPSSKNPGSKFLSVALTPKDERAASQRAPVRPSLEDDDDDIPF